MERATVCLHVLTLHWRLVHVSANSTTVGRHPALPMPRPSSEVVRSYGYRRTTVKVFEEVDVPEGAAQVDVFSDNQCHRVDHVAQTVTTGSCSKASE
jgi:hypothetical protein